MIGNAPRHVAGAIWPRLMTAAILNVTGWMVLMGLALLWLPASEATLIAYTMPVWASLLAWPVLGERPTLLRAIALVMAFAGVEETRALYGTAIAERYRFYSFGDAMLVL